MLISSAVTLQNYGSKIQTKVSLRLDLSLWRFMVLQNCGLSLGYLETIFHRLCTAPKPVYYIPRSGESVQNGTLCTARVTGAKVIVHLTVIGYSLKYRFSSYKYATSGYVFIKVEIVERGWVAPILRINFVHLFSVTTLLLTISLNLFSWIKALQYLRKLCNHPALVLTTQHPEYKRITEQLAAHNSSLRDIQHAPKLSALKQVSRLAYGALHFLNVSPLMLQFWKFCLRLHQHENWF